MQGKGRGWWAATLLGALTVVVAGVARALDKDGDDGAERAGYVFGAILGPVLLAAIVALALVRFADVSGYWAIPAVLGVAGLLNVVVLVAGAGGEAAERATCEDAPLLQAALLAPGEPYRTRPVTPSQDEKLEAQFSFPSGTRTDFTQVIDTRDRAAFLLVTATSPRVAPTDAGVFAEFAGGPGEVGETRMGDRPARAARRGDRTSIVATDGSCAVVLLVGAADQPTRALAAALHL